MPTLYNQRRTKTYTAASVADLQSSLIVLDAGSGIALTLPDPPSGADWDGVEIVIKPKTLQAYTVNNSAGSGFNGAGASGDIATFAGAAAAEYLHIVAYGGVWYTLGSSGVTIA